MNIRNPARERLLQGELSVGLGLRQARTVDIAAAMATCGFDWLFIDREHGTMPLDTAVQISVAALTAGISPIVRVPSGQYSLATRVLDGGALGIVMPHVDTPEEAREIAQALFISERTVENHIASMFNKLGIGSRAALAAHVAREGGNG